MVLAVFVAIAVASILTFSWRYRRSKPGPTNAILVNANLQRALGELETASSTMTP